MSGMRFLVLAAATLLSAGCVSVHPASPFAVPAYGWITPAEAVRAANDDPRHGISGVFVLTVRATGADGAHIYLNSEPDYRHQTSLTVVLPEGEREALQHQLGLPLERLVNRRLLVQGTAMRRTIVFTRDGKPSGKYYYQTQIHAGAARQLRFSP